MQIASNTILRCDPASVAAITTTTFTHFRSLTLTAKHQNPDHVSKKPQPNKNLLRAKHLLKDSLSPSLSPILPSSTDTPLLSQYQAIGTVAAAQANFMRVIVQSVPDEGSEGSRIGVELLCVVRALLKKIKRRIWVGDRVLVGSVDWVDGRGMIENVFQRGSEIIDPPVANVDQLLVLFSIEQPKLEPFTLTRFLVEAESTRIPLTLALNKSELVNQETLDEWKSKLHKWGYDPLFCSVESKHGLDLLASVLAHRTTVIMGPSGVGKSSLINVLRSNYLASDFVEIQGSKWFEDQRVGEVSTRSGRGKHTTRHVSLLPLSGGGYLADTPGFNQPNLLKVTKQSLAEAFPEIRTLLSAGESAKCSFNNCLHVGEPGCIVKGDWERYQYYLHLLDEIRIRADFQLRTYGTKNEGNVRYKVGDMGVQQAEPRLELKKHRRQSRKKMNQSLLDDLDELDEDDKLDLENDPILRAIENENR